MILNNHDAYLIDWYRTLISDGTAEAGQRIAVEMHDQLRDLEQQIKNEKFARDNPTQLSLDQIADMINEPVYVIDKRHPESSQWGIVIDYMLNGEWCVAMAAANICSAYPPSSYGTDWVAYASKPVEDKRHA